MKKMKVCSAAHIFSLSLSASMRALVRLGVTSLPKSASDTADFLLFGDKIFDSVNGSRIKPLAGKTLRCAITAESEHVQFWNQAARVLDSITFDNKGNDFIPPTISNWKTTRRGLKYIWNKYGSRLKFLCPHLMAHEINPTPAFFSIAFKTLILNNFMSTHSPGANCEDDNSEGPLDNLKNFLISKIQEPKVPIPVNPVLINDLATAESITVTNIHAYVAGYLVRRIRRETDHCKECICFLASDEESEGYTFIKMKEYGPNKL
ncbi:hypothetical protein MML48_9g00005385 [Holotrichia oblita]|uniref:Uncharacterized protein n=1 Tax=Holotrichia oblita TaxID=644536 RepID=A0ACB9SNM6_HOLOL|nr:hypothetical protein MML48_9g00005385 [Holotrichia oblita]